MPNKIKISLHSILLSIKFFIVNVLSKKHVELDVDSNLHISLTTYNKRLSKVYLTIESLFCQSVCPSSITLWLSNADVLNGLPSSIKRLQARGLTVQFYDENIRSYKKLYYSYLLHANDVNAKIITVDDDVFYPVGMLGMLYNAYVEKEGVICFRGHYITFDKNSELLPYKNWSSNINDQTKGAHLLPTGVGGVLYPINSLHGLKDQKNDFINICPTADDIWFKFLTLNNHFKSHRVFKNNFHPTPILSFDMKGLEKKNVFEGKNDEQLLKVISYFGIEL
jgi:hypothetical protein